MFYFHETSVTYFWAASQYIGNCHCQEFSKFNKSFLSAFTGFPWSTAVWTKMILSFLVRFTKLSSFSLYNLHYSATWGFKFTSLLDIRRLKCLIPKWFPLALLESIRKYCLFSQYCTCNLLLILQTVTQYCLVSSHSWQNCVGYTWMYTYTQ